eukprot:jgi/Astpho2/8219/Aster-x0807
MVRGLSTSHSGEEDPEGQAALERQRVREAIGVLQHVHMVQLRERLATLSDTRLHISHSELLQHIVDSSAAQTRAEAEHIAEALDTAGFVMRFRDKVYLRPAEIAGMVLQSVPDTRHEIAMELQKLKAQLEPLIAQKQEVDKNAHRMSQRVLWGGLAATAVVWAVCLRLTFW